MINKAEEHSSSSGILFSYFEERDDQRKEGGAIRIAVPVPHFIRDQGGVVLFCVCRVCC